MTFRRRVHTIYKKELIDILRDRRTLIAMIVVPIVLYPLLTLGSIQAVSYQKVTLEREKFVIGVLRASHADTLSRFIEVDTGELQAKRDAWDQESPPARKLAEPLENVEFRRFDSAEEIERAVKQRAVQVGVVFDRVCLTLAPKEQNHATFYFDNEEPRSWNAYARLSGLLARANERIGHDRLTAAGLPETLVEPFVWEGVDLSAPSSVLGQILPLILVLMTITGAIYPAIDLTAGERERGTLETLMVCPVRVIDLIFGKFLVVTTVAIMGATLNLASVSATVYFGGFAEIIATDGDPVPIGKMLVILLCLIPFAVLMSAIMIAVCSYARTFKEAQNYVTPVILAVLVPGGIGALPTTRLEGVMLVVPVGNMVLFARDMLLGATVSFWATATVLLSTTLYAAAAVAIAASVFGRESVVFADSASLKTTFSRKLIKPSDRPTISMALLLIALLFPAWFFVQSVFSPDPNGDASGLLRATAWLMPVMFVLLPVAILLYWKVSISKTLALRMPAGRYVVAAVLIGLSAWVPASELNAVQSLVLDMPEAMRESFKLLEQTLASSPTFTMIFIIAVLPALCEELLFRGFLLSGLRSSARKWTAIITSACIFGVFHFLLFRFPVTAALGVVLAYLCWQSRSIIPGMIVHFLHNGLQVASVKWPQWPEYIGIPLDAAQAHLPLHILAVGGVLFVLGLLFAARPPDGKHRAG